MIKKKKQTGGKSNQRNITSYNKFNTPVVIGTYQDKAEEQAAEKKHHKNLKIHKHKDENRTQKIPNFVKSSRYK